MDFLGFWYYRVLPSIYRVFISFLDSSGLFLISTRLFTKFACRVQCLNLFLLFFGIGAQVKESPPSMSSSSMSTPAGGSSTAAMESTGAGVKTTDLMDLSFLDKVFFCLFFFTFQFQSVVAPPWTLPWQLCFSLFSSSFESTLLPPRGGR